MDWGRLSSRYYLDAAIDEAGEAAEVLFLRAIAWCVAEENGGFVPRRTLPRLTHTRGPARADALVRVGLFLAVDGGWQIASFEKWQDMPDEIESKRRGGRERQAKHRAKRRANTARNGVTDGVTHAEVTAQEVEVETEVDAAAAAARDRDDQPDLPMPVLILRQALEAHHLRVRWNILTPAECDEIGELALRHGESALVKSALSQYRPDRPAATARAWLPAWRDLRAPGDLGLVKPLRCDRPGHQGTTARCAECASEKHAGER